MAKPITYSAANRELRSARYHFADKNESVSVIRWKPGIKRGKRINAGDHLATIIWEKSNPVVPPLRLQG